MRRALGVVRSAVRIFGLRMRKKLMGRFEGTCLSFNGGKDSTVLLHLLRLAFPENFQRIQIIFFKQQNEFPEVDGFIEELKIKCAPFTNSLCPDTPSTFVIFHNHSRLALRS